MQFPADLVMFTTKIHFCSRIIASESILVFFPRNSKLKLRVEVLVAVLVKIAKIMYTMSQISPFDLSGGPYSLWNLFH